jgi:hypothetical protein
MVKREKKIHPVVDGSRTERRESGDAERRKRRDDLDSIEME